MKGSFVLHQRGWDPQIETWCSTAFPERPVTGEGQRETDSRPPLPYPEPELLQVNEVRWWNYHSGWVCLLVCLFFDLSFCFVFETGFH